MTNNNYFLVDAPGTYGNRSRVWSSHRTLEAAQRAAGRGLVVRVGEKRKGDEWLRVYEETYPIAE